MCCMGAAQVTRAVSEAEGLAAALKAEEHLHAAGSSRAFTAAAEAAEGGLITGLTGIEAAAAAAKAVESKQSPPRGAESADPPIKSLSGDALAEVEAPLPLPARQPSKEACAEMAISAAAALYEMGQRVEQLEAELGALEGEVLQQRLVGRGQHGQWEETHEAAGMHYQSRVQVQQQMQLRGICVIDRDEQLFVGGEGDKAAIPAAAGAAGELEVDEDRAAEAREAERWAAEERTAREREAEEGATEKEVA